MRVGTDETRACDTVRGAGGSAARDAARGTRRRVVVVVGAGRSGTSAITRGVQAVGVELGERLRRGRGKNPTGFFEDEDLRAITNRVKRALGVRGESVGLIDAHRWHEPALQALRAEAVATIRRRFASHPVWGFKHGRTLRLLPFWREVFADLDLDVGYVVAVRNPLSVARSRGALDSRRGLQVKSDLEWLVSVVPNFPLCRDHRVVVVDYDLMMADPNGQLERLARGLELPITDDTRAAIEVFAREFLTPGLRHSRFTDADLVRDTSISPLVRDAYRWLHRLATDTVDLHAPALWKDWERIEGAFATLAPILGYVDHLEGELRRAKASPLGPLQAIPLAWRKLRGK